MSTLRVRLSAARPIRAASPGSRAPSAAAQPLAAELSALAALGSAADTLSYWTGSATAALTALTGFGRSLIAAADAPAAKVLLNLGLLASTVSGQTATLAGALTAPRSYTLPDTTGTLALLGLAQSWTALQTHTAGLSVTAGTTAVQALTATTITASGLTSGRIPVVGTAGLLGDAADFQYSSGALTVGGSVGGILRVDGPAASSRIQRFQTAGVNRWLFGTDTTAEGGSNTGCAFTIVACSDAGAGLDTPIMIDRAYGGTIQLGRNGRGVVIGSTALLASERLRVSGGTMGTPGATDVLLAGGKLYSGDTSATSIQTAGGLRTGANILNLQAVNGTCYTGAQNTSNGASAAAEVGATNDASVSCSFGLYGSGRTGSQLGIARANAAYLFTTAAGATSLIIGHTAVSSPILFGSNNIEVARFTGGTLASDSLVVKYTTTSSSTTTGAVTVAGGLGVAGRAFTGDGITLAASTGGSATILSLINNTGSITTLAKFTSSGAVDVFEVSNSGVMNIRGNTGTPLFKVSQTDANASYVTLYPKNGANGAVFDTNWATSTGSFDIKCASFLGLSIDQSGTVTFPQKITAKVNAAGAAMTTVAEIATYLRAILT